MNFINSLVTKEGLISLALVIVLSVILVMVLRNKGRKTLSTQAVVAIGIGAALYGALSFISIPLAPNTSLRIAIAILTIFGALFGPLVGFLVGFIGHALNDALMWGSVWWSWVFLSAIMGLFSGLITMDKNFDALRGKIQKLHIMKMYIYSALSIVAASAVAYLGDVFLYGEPADKVWLQIIVASISNFVVIAVLGIPAVIAIAKSRKKNRGLELD